MCATSAPPGVAGQLTAQTVARIKLTKLDGTLAELARTPAATLPATTEARMAAFTAADKDNDGKLDKAGFRTASRTLGFGDVLEFLFAQYDIDKDGFVSTDEVWNPPQQLHGPAPANAN